MREQIANAMPLSQYIFAYLSERYDLSLVEGKAKLMSQVRALTTALPKGSSFRYLLNNDIYQKLGGRRNQNKDARDALLDFDGEMTISQQLQLCFLFQPRTLIDDPIEAIWQQAGIHELQLPAHIKQKGLGRYSAPAEHGKICKIMPCSISSAPLSAVLIICQKTPMLRALYLSNVKPSTQETLSG